MAILRTPWTDDDGSGTTGTILNNAALQTIYTNVAAEVNTIMISDAPPSGVTLHNWAPGIVGHTLINLSPAGPITVTGLIPSNTPFAGQIVRFALSQSQTVTFLHENTGSFDGARLRLPKPSITISGFWGVMSLQYWPFTPAGFWVCVGHENGHGVALDIGEIGTGAGREP